MHISDDELFIMCDLLGVQVGEKAKIKKFIICHDVEEWHRSKKITIYITSDDTIY